MIRQRTVGILQNATLNVETNRLLLIFVFVPFHRLYLLRNEGVHIRVRTVGGEKRSVRKKYFNARKDMRF